MGVMRLGIVAFFFLACTPREAAVPPSDPQHIPGAAEDTAAIPEPVPDPVAAAAPQPKAHGHLVSGSDPQEGRLNSRPHAGHPSAQAKGMHKLGLGGERDGLVFLPTAYDPSRPTPMVVLLHGAGRDADRIMGSFRDRAEAQGIILLAPESRATTWDIVIQHKFGDDVAFIDRALAMAFDRWNIDPSRVAIAGFSDGASYALSLGLTNGDLFGQILAFSPGFAAPGLVTGTPRVFISHGTHDRVLPINGASRRMVPILESTGYDVRYKEFDGDHEIPPNVLDAAFTWLQTGR